MLLSHGRDSPTKNKEHDEDAKLLSEIARLYAPPAHEYDAKAAYFIEEITGDRPWWSTLVFEWFSPVIALGNARHLASSDLFPLKDGHLAAQLVPPLQAAWSEQRSRHGRNASLLLALLRVHGARFLSIGLLKLTHDALAITIPPLVIQLIIEYQQNVSASAVEGLFYAVCVAVTGVGLALAERHFEYFGCELALFVRSSLTTAAFQHTLVVSPSTLQRTPPEQIVSYVTTETAHLHHGLLALYQTLGGLLQLILGGVLLGQRVGNALWAGVVVAALSVPCTVLIEEAVCKSEAPLQDAKEERIQLYQEVLGGIKTLKLLAWERHFASRVMELREIELQRLKTYLFAVGCKTAFTLCVPVVVAVATLLTHSLLVQGPLTLSTTLTTLTLLLLLTQGPVKSLRALTTTTFSAYKSLRTLDIFLNEPERAAATALSTNVSSTVGIVLKNADFKWDTAQPKTELDLMMEAEGILQVQETTAGPVLHHINFYAGPGELHAVVGAAGSGKSTLLAGIAGLARCSAGDVAVKGSVVYVTTEPFLLSASIRDNICFGKPFEAHRYFDAVRASCLKYDLRAMPRGDRTQFSATGATTSGSEGSVNLTAGQRVRVALARSVYHDADIYVLDDVLAEMDPLIATKIIRKCLRTALRDKIVVMATHSLAILKRCQNVTVLARGTIVESGSLKMLVANKKWGLLSDLVRITNPNPNPHKRGAKNQQEMELAIDVHDDDDSGNDGGDADSDTEALSAMLCLKQFAPIVAGTEASETMAPTTRNDENAGTSGDTGHDDENVRSAVALWLIRSLGERGYLVFTLLVALFVTTHVLQFVSFAQIAQAAISRDEGAGADDSASTNRTTAPLQEAQLDGYIAFSLMHMLFAIASLAALTHSGLHASHLIFQVLLDRLTRAPMAFYDAATPTTTTSATSVTSSSRAVVTRLAKDMHVVERGVAHTWPHLLSTTAQLLVTTGVLLSVSPWLIIALAPLMLAFYRVEECVGTPARDLDKVETATAPPVDACVAEVLRGMVAIRQYKAEHLFTGQFQQRLDTHMQAVMFRACVHCWLGIRVDFIYVVLVTCVALASVHVHYSSSPTTDPQSTAAALHVAGKVGVALLVTAGLLPVLFRFLHACDKTWSILVAGARIKAHSKMPIEAPLDSIPELRPTSATDDDDWPSAGRIEFDNVSVRYRQGLPRIVRGVSFTVSAGESVAIIGHAGAGKKTLFTAITRLVELTTGTITIDGVDISKVGLHELRSKVAWIGPEPVLFAGSIRLNLDATQRCSDDEIWSVLRKVQLHNGSVLSLGEEVHEKGCNYSLGERMLLSVARAMLRKPKILMVDQGEWLPATAASAMIAQTDADQIEQSLREEFPAATRLTITHRVATATEATRVLVMENGQVAECGTPKELQKSSKSIYRATLEQWKRRGKDDRKK